MADRPIIFSAPMIRALLDGRKTQTRRALKDQPPAYCVTAGIASNGAGWSAFDSMGDGFAISVPYEVGDRLWVREAHAFAPASAYRMSEGVTQAVNPQDRDRAAIYREGFDRSTGGIRWRPSIHMPRWASRLTLTVTDVRVQRLQDISEADAVAEGVEPIRHEWWQGFVRHSDGSRGVMETGSADGPPPDDFERPEKQVYERSALDGFHTLWNTLHGPDAWDANPWVAAVTFTVRKGNIDKEQADG